VPQAPEGFSHKPGATTPASLLPNFIPMSSLNQEAMEALRPLHEEWAGVKLRNGQVWRQGICRRSATTRHFF
jgi:hypothetical protein